MHAYCFQCQSQKCKLIAHFLEERNVGRAFSPQILQRHRKQGQTIDRYFDLLPGYIFLYTEEPIKDFTFCYQIDGIIRRLGYGDESFALQGKDYDFAMGLYRRDGKIGEITVFKIGDTVKMDNSLFGAYNGTIEYIDYRKKRAKLRYHFDGQDRIVWTACNTVFKDALKDLY